MAEQGNVVHIPGDPPHAVQLVLGDLLESPDFVNVCETANKIADKFKNTKLKGYLKEELGLVEERVGVAMAVVTRWGTHLNLFQSLIELETELKGVHKGFPVADVETDIS